MVSSMYSYVFCIIGPETDHLINIVAPVIATQWKHVAVNLEFNESRINAIRQQGNEIPEDCCRELLIHWVGTTTDGTWTTLLNAVKQVGDLSEAYDEIKQNVLDLRTM